MRVQRMVWGMLVLLPLLACGDDALTTVQTQQDPTQARARWDALGVSSYTVEMKLDCFCDQVALLWHELRIEEDHVVSARRLLPAPADRLHLKPAPAACFPTVSTLFARIAAEREKPDGSWQGEYDVHTGLPVNVVVGWLANDSGIRYELRLFRPLPPL